MASSQPAPAVVTQPRFAGLGRRLAAYFVDLPIFVSPVFAAGFSIRGLRASGLWRPAGDVSDPIMLWHALGAGAKLAVFFAYLLGLGVIYFALFESSAWQATVGKRLLNIYVTNDEGSRISAGRAFGRWFWKFLLSYFGINLVSLATIAWRKDKKAIHDMLATTLVVRARPVPGGMLGPWRIAAAFGIPFAWILTTFLATL